MSRASVLRKYNSVEVKCAYFGGTECAVSEFTQSLRENGIINVKYIPDTRSVLLTPRKGSVEKITSGQLFHSIALMCDNCTKHSNKNVKQRVQETPKSNVQVFPYTTSCEEQKIQEVEALPKIYCKLQQNKKQNER